MSLQLLVVCVLASLLMAASGDDIMERRTLDGVEELKDVKVVSSRVPMVREKSQKT